MNSFTEWNVSIMQLAAIYLLDQSFELGSVIKFSLVTAQQMRCFDINSLIQSTVWSESFVGIGYSCLTSKSGPSSAQQRNDIQMMSH